ncbi:hypothetical protein [Flavobacterium amniphilum]|uniref:hypothetical protein n=1 Tax=Flavobacterium amniphilum TaxID=1834035 RepID=UPI00202AA7BC|nr:hypothetical protein [Flavobacterium amniphilum]
MKVVLTLLAFLMLVLYAPEMPFMPHYQYRPDMWHLFYTMVTFCTALIICFLWAIIRRHQKENFILIISLSVGFLLLNQNNGNWSVTGYCSIAILFLFLSANSFPN